MYKALLMDFDDTLYDFRYQSYNSLKRALSLEGIVMTDEMFDNYEMYNREFWIDFESGRYKDSTFSYIRFQKLKERYDFKYDARKFNKEYLTNLYRFLKPIENADELVKKLSEKYKVYIITNGLTEAQIPKLDASGLKPYTQKMFISEQIGCSKPSKEYFDKCAQEIGLKKSEMLIIGDSLASDILGGVNSGIDTCWFNNKDTHNNSALPITYTVTSMKELAQLLEVKL